MGEFETQFTKIKGAGCSRTCNSASSRADCGRELEIIGEVLEWNTVGVAEVRPNNDSLVG